MERVSSIVTRGVASHWGELFPFYYLMEFPKSGGSWVADMIADYLQIPRPVRSVFPIGCEAVLHGHWRYSPRYSRVFYLYRDGRDVAVSQYFRILEEIRNPKYRGNASYFGRRYPDLVSGSINPEDARATLPRFLENWVRQPAGTRQNWRDHITEWTCDRPGVVLLSYEDLLNDAHRVLSQSIPIHSGKPVDHDRLAATIHKYSFEQQTGRQPGSEVRGALIRKGIAGDWKNHFTREAAQIFDFHLGETLIDLGYETSRDWPNRLPDT